jgi:hypothetical protein
MTICPAPRKNPYYFSPLDHFPPEFPMTFATPTTDPITAQRRVVIPEAVLIRVLGEESVLLNLDSESYFGLDAVGTRMWNAIASAPSLRAAFDELAAEYEVDPSHLRTDLAGLVRELSEAGLVRLVDV